MVTQTSGCSIERAGSEPALRHSGKTYTAGELGKSRKVVESGRETNRRSVVEQRLVWGGPNYVIVIIGKAIHDGTRRSLEGVNEVKGDEVMRCGERIRRVVVVNGGRYGERKERETKGSQFEPWSCRPMGHGNGQQFIV